MKWTSIKCFMFSVMGPHSLDTYWIWPGLHWHLVISNPNIWCQATTVSLENSSNIYSPVYNLEIDVLRYCITFSWSILHCQIHSRVSRMSVAGSANSPSAFQPILSCNPRPPPLTHSDPLLFLPSFLPAHQVPTIETAPGKLVTIRECHVRQNVTSRKMWQFNGNVTLHEMWHLTADE